MKKRNGKKRNEKSDMDTLLICRAHGCWLEEHECVTTERGGEGDESSKREKLMAGGV